MIPQTILLSSVLVLQTLGFVAAHPTPSDVGLGVDVDTVVPEDCYPCDDDHDYGYGHSYGGGDNDDYTEIVTTTGGLPGPTNTITVTTDVHPKTRPTFGTATTTACESSTTSASPSPTTTSRACPSCPSCPLWPSITTCPTGSGTITIPGPTTTVTETDTTTGTITKTKTDTEIITLPPTTTTTTTTTTKTLPCPTATGHHRGKCSHTTIKWAYGLDGRAEWSWVTNNQADFPHGSSTTINTLTEFICNRLATSCNAQHKTVELCYQSAWEVDSSELTGEDKSNLWNKLMT